MMKAQFLFAVDIIVMKFPSNLSVYLSVYLSLTLQPFVGLWPLFQFFYILHSRQVSLDGGSARRKAQGRYLHTDRTDSE
jgi:hypothetical protein